MKFDTYLIDYIKKSSRIVVLSGAGISQESDIPTFRDSQTGLWAQYSPFELASPEAFANNPMLVWEWYHWRRKTILDAKPNLAHQSLKEMEQIFPEFWIITQNVDGLHQAAGSKNVIEMHGNIHRARCQFDSHVSFDWDKDGDFPPTCPVCGVMMRPDVIWFGESIPGDALRESIHLCQNAEVMLVVGTSGLVEPASSLPIIGLNSGAMLVEFNVEKTLISGYAQYSLIGKAAFTLPQLLRQIRL